VRFWKWVAHAVYSVSVVRHQALRPNAWDAQADEECQSMSSDNTNNSSANLSYSNVVELGVCSQ